MNFSLSSNQLGLVASTSGQVTYTATLPSTLPTANYPITISVADTDTTVPFHSATNNIIIPIYNYGAVSATLPQGTSAVGTPNSNLKIQDTLNLSTASGRDITQALTNVGWAPNVTGTGQQDYRVHIQFFSAVNMIGFSHSNNANIKNNIKNIGVYSNSNYTSSIKSFTNGSVNSNQVNTQMYTLNAGVNTVTDLYFHIIVNSSVSPLILSDLTFYTN